MQLWKKYLPIYLKIIAFSYWIVLTIRSLYLPMLSSDADAYSRLGLVLFESYDGSWLPLYSRFIEWSLNFIEGPFFVGPRLISWISILISAIFVEKIIYKSTHSSFLSVFGLAIFLFHPLVVDISTITFVEPVWTLFVLISLYYCFYSNRKNSLYLGLVLWSVGQGLRYESWMLTPIVLFFLWQHKKINKKNIAPVLFLFTVIPIAWISFCYLEFNNGLEFFRIKKLGADINPIPEFGHFSLILSSWSQRFFSHIFPIIGIIPFLVSYFFIRKKADRIFFVIPLVLFFSLVVQVYTKNMEHLAIRYLYLTVPLIIIATFIGISHLNQDHRRHLIFKTVLILTTVYSLISVYFSKNFPVYSKGMNQSEEIIQLSQNIDTSITTRPNFAFVHTKMDFSDNFMSYLTQYKMTVFSYNCNEHLELNSDTNSAEAVKWLEQSDYLLYQKDQKNSSCTFLLNNRLLVNKTENFELYIKNDNSNSKSK